MLPASFYTAELSHTLTLVPASGSRAQQLANDSVNMNIKQSRNSRNSSLALSKTTEICLIPTLQRFNGFRPVKPSQAW